MASISIRNSSLKSVGLGRIGWTPYSFPLIPPFSPWLPPLQDITQSLFKLSNKTVIPQEKVWGSILDFALLKDDRPVRNREEGLNLGLWL